MIWYFVSLYLFMLILWEVYLWITDEDAMDWFVFPVIDRWFNFNRVPPVLLFIIKVIFCLLVSPVILAHFLLLIVYCIEIIVGIHLAEWWKAMKKKKKKK